MPRSVNVVVEPGHLEIAPGATAQLHVRIANRTGVVDQFVVVVLGLEPRMTPPPQRIGLFPDQDGTLTINLAVPAEQPPPAGQRVLAVRITSQDDPRLSRVEEFQLTVGPVAAASIRVQPPRIRGGRSGRFAVLVSNEGNVPVQVALRGEDEAEEVSFAFEPPLVDLPPGGSMQADGRATAPRPFSGPETVRPITVHGEGGPVPLLARATLVQRSVVGSRLLRAAAVLALLAVILGIFLSTRRGNGPQSNAHDGPSDSPTATVTSGSSTPTPTNSGGNGEGPVPDVSGQSAGAAAGALTSAGFLTEKVFRHSNAIGSGSVIGTDPSPGRTAGSDHRVTLIVSDGPTPPFDMLDAAQGAAWSNDSEGLQFNGQDNDPRGFAILRKNLQLEDGNVAAQALETRPQGVPDGAIQGDYPLPSPVITGDHFVCDVGFAAGQPGEVDFIVFLIDDQGEHQVGDPVHDTGADGVIQHIDLDLSQFAGATKIRLRVTAGASADSDAAIWINPRVTGTPAG